MVGVLQSWDSCPQKLHWFDRYGFGFYPVRGGRAPYDRAYFDKLAGYAETNLGRGLMRARVAMVARHYSGTLVDYGSGCGAFIEERSKWRANTLGWDVNPVSVEWLDRRGLLFDPNLQPVDALSMWDVLEHIADFRHLLANVNRWLFVSLPIFRDADHVLGSKHYRPDEHFWYFTRDGFVDVMRGFGFTLAEENKKEIELGREDISSFAFTRDY